MHDVEAKLTRFLRIDPPAPPPDHVYSMLAGFSRVGAACARRGKAGPHGHAYAGPVGIDLPDASSYPAALEPFLHRKVWRATVAAVESRLHAADCRPVFVKPVCRQKRFTGCVLWSERDLGVLHGVSRQEPVDCSEVVAWVTEYRVHVVRSEIRAVAHYAGDEGVAPDARVLESAVAALARGERSPAGYAVDFGVLEGGQTALVEMNDGFCRGCLRRLRGGLHGHGHDAVGRAARVAALSRRLSHARGRQLSTRPFPRCPASREG